MAKDKKYESKKKANSAAAKSALKKQEPKQKAVSTKTKSKAEVSEQQPATWVATAYQLGSVIRVGKKILHCAHPASYFKLAKDNIGMPLAQNFCGDATQNFVYISTEIIECAISPTIYTVNKVVHLISSLSSFMVKVSFDVQNPELRAAVDVVFTEAAYQTTNRVFSNFNKDYGYTGFFKKTDTLKVSTNNTEQFIPHEQYKQMTRFPSKL